MIACLSGKILSIQEKTLVLDVHGVGYLVHVPRGVLQKMTVGSDATLFTHTHVREDDLSLYGFLTQEQWTFFRMLLGVSGIGPKSALEILNAPLANVKNAIAKKEAAYLTQIPGIGRKTAERIIIDLEGKMKESIMQADGQNEPAPHEDIVQALISLGYHRQQVTQGLKKIPQDINGEEAIIKYFLQNI